MATYGQMYRRMYPYVHYLGYVGSNVLLNCILAVVVIINLFSKC